MLDLENQNVDLWGLWGEGSNAPCAPPLVMGLRVKRSILIGSQSSPNFAILKRYSKGNILALSRDLFLVSSDQKFWQKFCKNGIIKTNFCRLIVVRVFHQSNVLCHLEV